MKKSSRRDKPSHSKSYLKPLLLIPLLFVAIAVTEDIGSKSLNFLQQTIFGKTSAQTGADNAGQFTDTSLLSAQTANLEDELFVTVSFQDFPAYESDLELSIDPETYSLPDISSKDISSLIILKDLDELGRCQGSGGILGPDTLPTEERENISSVWPTGFSQQRCENEDCSEYFYNRCHLTAFCLSGLNAEEKNLVTGTRDMNLAMTSRENETLRYIEESGNHVLYRAQPVFEKDELTCRGILLSARSIEDNGKGLNFSSYFYNVHPDSEINYKDGTVTFIAKEDTDTWSILPEEEKEESSSSSTSAAKPAADTEPEPEPEPAPVPDPTPAADPVPVPSVPDTDSAQTPQVAYIGNRNSDIFHYPTCSSVAAMKEKNKIFLTSREEAISMNLRPCKRCNP